MGFKPIITFDEEDEYGDDAYKIRHCESLQSIEGKYDANSICIAIYCLITEIIGDNIDEYGYVIRDANNIVDLDVRPTTIRRMCPILMTKIAILANAASRISDDESVYIANK